MTELEFVIDMRELKLIKMLEEYKSELNIKFSVEQLTIGDIIFREHSKIKNTVDDKEVLEEHVDTILYVERKTVADLSASIKDGRSAEQKERLKASTSRNRIIYLIEGNMEIQNITDRLEGLPAKSLYGNLINTQLKHGIQVYKTSSLRESALYLIRLYQKLSTERDDFFTEKNSTDFDYAKTIKKEKKANMTPRILMHYTLCQIPSMSDMKAEPIVEKYGSISNLIEAFKTVPEEMRKKMLSDIRYKNKSGKDTRIGVSSVKVHDFLIGNN